jgi:hypothetical protein
MLFYGCKTWPHVLRKEHRLKVFENSVLRKVFDLRRTKWHGIGKDYTTSGFMICTTTPNIIRGNKSR